MNRRSFLHAAAAGSPASLAAFQQASPAPSGRWAPGPAAAARPNVIWVFGDQLRAQALSGAGDPNARTPNLDRAGVNGVTFTRAVSGFPLCCPFRGSLLAGRYPHRCVPGHEYPLPEGQKTIADVFNANDYRTAYFGKWHLGGWHERDGRAAFFITDPARRGGFQTWLGYENNNSQWDSWVHGGSGRDAVHYRLPGYETDALTDRLIAYIKDRKTGADGAADPPFFAALSVQPPHDPYVAPERFMANYNPERLTLRPNVAHAARVEKQARLELAGYYAMIENLDWNFGRIMTVLEETGELDRTHVLFFSDHGDMHGSQGMFRKTNPFEESIRIPMVITGGIPRAPGWKTGAAPVPLNHVDIAPTTLGLCGIPKPDWMEGRDYSYFRIGRNPTGAEADSAYLQNVIPTGHPDSINTPYRGLVTRDGWKYVCFENRAWLLFDLNEDPYEQANLAQNNRVSAQRKRLAARLRQWVADTGDTFAVPAD
jgi:arylsulfatase A-like enzyme